MKDLLRAWFRMREPVSARAYFLGGCFFMLLKFALERTYFEQALHRTLTPGAFLSPFFVDRAMLLRGAPESATWVLLVIALPFLWIGVSLSVRRALDAGFPPIIGFLFLIPILHYLLILTLCVASAKRPKVAAAPPQDGLADSDDTKASQLATGTIVELLSPQRGATPQSPIFRAIFVSTIVGLAMFGICVYLLRDYGNGLFLATPFVMGAIATRSYRAGLGMNEPKAGAALGAGCLSVLCVGLVLLVTANQGGMCILMAAIPAVLLSTVGGLLGLAIPAASATRRRDKMVLLLLPLAAGAEYAVQGTAQYEVTSSIVIDAPPEVVWNHVVSFPDLEAPTEWMFRRGIAYPVRARIEGHGVGATRYCEFSTGTFVEPITRWDAPTTLSFDVASAPPPMREWSFWDRVEAPHLDGFMRSKRGEFRLIPLPGNRTRLEGSTFYDLKIFPELYWKAITDRVVHTIHLRVLSHIKVMSESDGAETAPSENARSLFWHDRPR